MKSRAVAEYVLVALGAVAVALLLQAYIVKPYRIPSESMAATLVPQDRVLVNRVVYKLHGPRRGDVVVFDCAAVGRVLIKRVVGMPGDVVSLRGGHVYIDGVRLREPYVRRIGGRPQPTEPFRGTGRPWSLEQPYRVPEGHYFLMGDNRTVSDDSRDWGPAARGDLIGEAFFTYWPLSRLHTL